MSDYTVINADDVDDVYAGSSVPGEFRPLSDALGTEQVAVTLIRVPPHCDFEQGTGHYHEEQEELYLVTRGTLTMRFGRRRPEGRPRLGRAGSAAHTALAPQRGRRAGGDVGGFDSDRRRRRGQDRRVLGGVAGRGAGAARRLSQRAPPCACRRSCYAPPVVGSSASVPRPSRSATATAIVVVALAAAWLAGPAGASTLPSGFAETGDPGHSAALSGSGPPWTPLDTATS